MIRLLDSEISRNAAFIVAMLVSTLAVGLTGCGVSEREATEEFAQCTLDNGYVLTDHHDGRIDILFDLGSKSAVLQHLELTGQPSDEKTVVARRAAIIKDGIRKGVISIEYIKDLRDAYCN